MFSSFPLNILYFFPGYVRIRVKEIKKNAEYGKKIENLLMTIRGITKVEFNTTTGSLLIRYNPASIDVERLIQTGRENHFLPEDHSLDIETARKILTRGV